MERDNFDHERELPRPDNGGDEADGGRPKRKKHKKRPWEAPEIAKDNVGKQGYEKPLRLRPQSLESLLRQTINLEPARKEKNKEQGADKKEIEAKDEAERGEPEAEKIEEPAVGQTEERRPTDEGEEPEEPREESKEDAETEENDDDDELERLNEEEEREAAASYLEARESEVAEELAQAEPDGVAAVEAQAAIEFVEEAKRELEADKQAGITKAADKALKATARKYAPDAAAAMARETVPDEATDASNGKHESPAGKASEASDGRPEADIDWPDKADRPATPETEAVPLQAGQPSEDGNEAAASTPGDAGSGGNGRGVGRGGAPYAMGGSDGFHPGLHSTHLQEAISGSLPPEEAERPHSHVSPAGTVLAVGLAAYFLGRRGGWKRTERRLKPIREQLEHEVRKVHEQLAHQEARVRELVREQARIAAPEARQVPAAVVAAGREAAADELIRSRRNTVAPATDRHTGHETSPQISHGRPESGGVPSQDERGRPASQSHERDVRLDEAIPRPRETPAPLFEAPAGFAVPAALVGAALHRDTLQLTGEQAHNLEQLSARSGPEDITRQPDMPHSPGQEGRTEELAPKPPETYTPAFEWPAESSIPAALVPDMGRESSKFDSKQEHSAAPLAELPAEQFGSVALRTAEAPGLTIDRGQAAAGAHEPLKNPEHPHPQSPEAIPYPAAEHEPKEELLKEAEAILVGNANVRQVFETNLISERGLRRTVAEFKRGGDVRKVLAEELLIKELGYERDPRLRDQPVVGGQPSPGGGSSNAGAVTAGTPTAVHPDAQTASQPTAVPPQQITAAPPHDTPHPRTTLIVANVIAIAILLGLVVVLLLVYF